MHRHAVRAQIPDAAFIGFPRGAAGMVAEYAEKTGVNALGLDYSMPVAFADSILPRTLPVQGNLDPLRLVAGGKALGEGIAHILSKLGGGPLIFNLGHGILPETPISHVEWMLGEIRRTER